MALESLASFLLPRPLPGHTFAEGERRTLAAAAEVLLEGIAFEISTDELIHNIERFLGSSRRAWRVRVFLVLVERAPTILRARRRFSRLPAKERARLLRAELKRMRPLIQLGAYASQEAHHDVGWVPVPERARFRLPVMK